jgi:hypothetical protein
MTLYLLKVHLQTFHIIPINKECQILTCDTLVANERHMRAILVSVLNLPLDFSNYLIQSGLSATDFSHPYHTYPLYHHFLFDHCNNFSFVSPCINVQFK